MGRKFPQANDPSQSFHQTPSVPVFLAGMAAAIAISAALCGVRLRRKSESPSNKRQQNLSPPLSSPSTALTPLLFETPNDVKAKQTEAATKIVESSPNSIENETQVPLPSAKQLKQTFPNRDVLRKSASTKNLAKNLSMKMQRSMSLAIKDRLDKKISGRLKPEDSVWRKTIILGEKCRVSEEDEGTFSDPKGNRISAYHPKTPSALPLSRQNSVSL